MTNSRSLALLAATLALQACGGALPEDQTNDGLGLSRKVACKTMDDCANGGLCEARACVASACNHRAPNKTGIRAMVRISRYQGLIHGANGTHEIAYGTLATRLWVHDPKVVDTQSVQLALNVSSTTDAEGLPHEIPLPAGALVELEGEYISGASAGRRGVAVIHFAHSTCGFVAIGGATYR